MLNGLAGATSGDLNTVLNAIDSLTNNNSVANALQQISPDKAEALSSLAFAGANLQKSVLSRRITDLRFGPGNAGLTAGGLGSFDLNYTQGAGLMVASSAESLAGLLSGQMTPTPWRSPRAAISNPGMILGDGELGRPGGFDFAIAGSGAGGEFTGYRLIAAGRDPGWPAGAGFTAAGAPCTGDAPPMNAYAAYLPKPFWPLAPWAIPRISMTSPGT